jgi:glutamate/tyrosine decarboxylase-like PLP-dependent enzyme
VSGDYLPAGDAPQPADYTPELSRRARGVDVWAALRTLGQSGVVAMIEGFARHARRFAASWTRRAPRC